MYYNEGGEQLRWLKGIFNFRDGIVFSLHSKARVFYKILIFVVIIFCSAFAQSTDSFNADFKISLDKLEYALAEPIFLKITFINLSGSIIKLDPIDLEWSIQFFNKDDERRIPYFGARWDKVAYNEVAPFDTVIAEINLTQRFGTGFKHEGIAKQGFSHLKVGTYKVYCTVLGIKSNSILFTVSNSNSIILKDYLEISRKEAEINTKYRSATNQERKALFLEYQNLVDSFVKTHSNSRYAEAVLFEFLVQCSLGGAKLLNLDYRDGLHKYYKLYPDSPYSAELVGHEWALLMKTMSRERVVAEMNKVRTAHPSLRKRIDNLMSQTKSVTLEK